MACYTLERLKSLRSVLAPCPQQQPKNIAVLDLFYIRNTNFTKQSEIVFMLRLDTP